MASVAITSTQKWRGKDIVLTTEIEVGPDSSHRACITEIQAKVTIENESGEKEVVAGYKSYTLDKSVRSRRAPAWLSEVLLEPLNYSHDKLNHSVTDDPQDDLTKIFKLIFGHDGKVKEKFAQWAGILFGDQIHYIDTFEVVERFRGTGMARVAVISYKQALRQLNNGHAFNGTIILSPAGLRSVREKMQQDPRRAGRPIKSFLEIEDALVAGYEQDGFKVCHRGDRTQEGAAITIMGMSMAQRDSVPSARSNLNQTIQALQRQAQSRLLLDDMRQLSISPSAQRPRTEPPTQPDTTATTTPIDNDDSAIDGSDQSAKEPAGASSMPVAAAYAAHNSSDNRNAAPTLPLPMQTVTSSTGQNANPNRRRSQHQKASRMLAELTHKNDQNGVNPHMQPDDGRRYEATNGARYQLASGTKAHWIKKDLNGATFGSCGAIANAATRPSLRPKRRAAESQVTGGGFKKVDSGLDRLLITTGMDDNPASRSAEPIDGWHPDCLWAVEDFVDERLSEDGQSTSHVLIDWATHGGDGTKWESTWEEYDMLNDRAKELYQQWRIETGRALIKKRRRGG